MTWRMSRRLPNGIPNGEPRRRSLCCDAAKFHSRTEHVNVNLDGLSTRAWRGVSATTDPRILVCPQILAALVWEFPTTSRTGCHRQPSGRRRPTWCRGGPRTRDVNEAPDRGELELC